MCLLFHKWTKWDDPILAQTTRGHEVQVQRRVCQSCNAVEFRRVPAYYG